MGRYRTHPDSTGQTTHLLFIYHFNCLPQRYSKPSNAEIFTDQRGCRPCLLPRGSDSSPVFSAGRCETRARQPPVPGDRSPAAPVTGSQSQQHQITGPSSSQCPPPLHTHTPRTPGPDSRCAGRGLRRAAAAAGR